MSGSSHPKGGEVDPRIGTLLADRYRIDALIGEGGMGKVYSAEHVLMRKRLAVKVLRRELTSVPEVVARFEREAMAAGNIEHPNVAGATDFGKLPDGAVFLVLEFVSGHSLRDEIARGNFEVERALHITRQIASALSAAHLQGIVHRDLKPENVMLVEKGGDPDFVKVLDFGIAKVPIGDLDGVAKGGNPITKAGMVFGTPEYMAPEQALGQNVDGRADLYALGVILFEMLAGVRPFTSQSSVGILGQQLSKLPPSFAERAPGTVVPPATELIVRKLLARESAERFQTAVELARAIDEQLAPIPGQGVYRYTLSDGSRSSLGDVEQIVLPAARASAPSVSGLLSPVGANGLKARFIAFVRGFE
ncbi:MAG TPA: serine/threonine-protein kinase, partial [Polyangiaceae bacterium]|nr:serine/threonine-protein kinase [Polyangiaceae bacterium]